MTIDEMKATERWLDLRRRLAIKYLDSVQVIVTGLEAGQQMDLTTFESLKDITAFCDKVLLSAKDTN
ncbi:hypothetical protein [Rhizobium phage RHEph16]|uniref:Uncharacterized protein n=1 Tax=Rhizobium phage RHEph16 TaxID=2836132 RepID=A0AAE7VM74_9CAUD|nr:hypothetical protein PP750_gp16 [Rhizobium phage RHEph16]QXV74325.1 hypothetical protein [Rhizobium phage RHEph16]